MVIITYGDVADPDIRASVEGDGWLSNVNTKFGQRQYGRTDTTNHLLPKSGEG